MSGNLHLFLDAHLAKKESILPQFGMLVDPDGYPTNKVGSGNGHGFLQVNGWFGTHFQAIEIEDLFGFFDTGFDRLASVVLAKPGRQSGCYRRNAEVC